MHQHFIDAERECEAILKAGSTGENSLHKCVFPAYDQCIKASHVFNLMDARGVISVTERQGYILARAQPWCASAAEASSFDGCRWFHFKREGERRHA